MSRVIEQFIVQINRQFDTDDGVVFINDLKEEYVYKATDSAALSVWAATSSGSSYRSKDWTTFMAMVKISADDTALIRRHGLYDTKLVDLLETELGRIRMPYRMLPTDIAHVERLCPLDFSTIGEPFYYMVTIKFARSLDDIYIIDEYMQRYYATNNLSNIKKIYDYINTIMCGESSSTPEVDLSDLPLDDLNSSEDELEGHHEIEEPRETLF